MKLGAELGVLVTINVLKVQFFIQQVKGLAYLSELVTELLNLFLCLFSYFLFVFQVLYFFNNILFLLFYFLWSYHILEVIFDLVCFLIKVVKDIICVEFEV